MEPINSPSALGMVLRRRRVDLRLTQEDLALSIGVNRRVIGQLENGKETIQLDIALRAARALGLNIGVAARGQPGA